MVDGENLNGAEVFGRALGSLVMVAAKTAVVVGVLSLFGIV